MNKEEKKELMFYLKKLNWIIDKYERDPYLSKQHFIDAFDSELSRLAEYFKLDPEKTFS